MLLSTLPAEAEVKFAPLASKRVEEIASILPATPQGFGSNYRDRAAWETIGKQPAFAKVISNAESLLKTPFPAWDDDLYLEFSRKGTRPAGEQMMSRRHTWLSALVWAECIENRGRFIPTLEKILLEYVHEPTWTLPAHDRKLTNFHRTAYEVDLGSAGFGQDLAQAIYLLDDKIKPEVRQEVLKALETRMFGPVRQSYRTGKGHWWLTTTNNWNAVCLAGVTCAALAVLPDRKDRAFFVAGAERYSRNSVEGFNADGYCTEGPGYYNYGFSNYIVLRERLWQTTGGKLDLFADPKIRKIAMYGPNITIINNICPAFADCRFVTSISTEILWYCSRVLGLGLSQYDNLSFVTAGTLNKGSMHAFPNSAIQTKPATTSATTSGIRSYFDSTGVLIVRPTPGSPCKMAAALKGGHNAEHHNHNSVGSYALVVGREYLVGDPGGPWAYTDKTFGPERYTLYKSLASYGHPVPLVAGIQQKEGITSRARVTKTDFTPETDTFTMDISSAYPVPGLKQLSRTFRYSRTGQGELSIQDDFALSEPGDFETALVTHYDWKQVSPDTLEFSHGEEKVQAVIHSPVPFTITSEKIDENQPVFTRIGIRLTSKTAQGTVTITFKPSNQ